MRLASPLLVVLATVAAAGCGLTLDLDPPDPDAGAPTDGAPPRLDAAGPDGGGPDCASVDDDGDGYDACVDCDDGDERVYPGAPLVCGDGVVNRCPFLRDGEDPECAGVFVAPDGDDAATGSPTDPLLTIGEGLRRATLSAAPAVYVAHGTYMEAAPRMANGVSLHGGLARSSWRRDRVGETRLVVGSADGLEVPADVRPSTSLTGITVESGAPTSSATVTVRGAGAPLIRDCVIVGGGAGGASVAIAINEGARLEVRGGVVIAQSRVELGQGATTGATGIYATRAEITVTDTRVVLANGVAGQTGIHLEDAPAAQLSGVIVAPDDPATVPSGRSAGLFIDGGGATVDASVFASGACVDNCFGVKIEHPTRPVTITNVRAVAAGEGSFAAGLLLKVGDEAIRPILPPVLVHSSFFGGGGLRGVGDGLLLDLVGPQPVQVGRFLNNMFWGRADGGPSRAVREIAAASGDIEPVAFLHNALFDREDNADAYFLDAGFALDVDALNLLDWASGNIFDACGVDPFVDPPQLALPAGSACVDAGASEDVPDHDIDGDPRPVGLPDIGPDERPAP